ILLGLLYIGVTGFLMEGLRLSINPVGWQRYSFVGSLLGGYFSSVDLVGEAGKLLYGVMWWSHALATFTLVASLPYTGLAHILSSTLNVMVSEPTVSGKLHTPFLLEELMEMEDVDVTMGVNTITGFDWQQKLGLDACTNCGRCEAACPAWAAGTPLSPRLVVQDLKSEVENVYLSNGGTSPILDSDIVTEDQTWACTYCGACTQACPVAINPVQYLTEFRRHLTFEGKLDKTKNETLTHLSTHSNPYGLTPTKRQELTEELGVPTLKENRDVEYLYWIGCVATYDDRSIEIAKAVVKILKTAGVSFGVLGAEERCTGDPARRFGEEARFQELASENIDTFKKYSVKKILTHCPHCFNTFKNEYPDLGGDFEVIHHSQLIRNLLEKGRISLKETVGHATLHDACYMGRFNQVYDAPREVLRAIPGLELVEMDRTKEKSFCCGAGGCNYWYDVPQEERVSVIRTKEAGETRADLLAVECPFCLPTLEDGAKIEGLDETMKVKDISEIVAEAL
ncbi:MAG: (Fe-S)-binding protein, partial [Candidatus Geothermarchaeales archaeon]